MPKAPRLKLGSSLTSRLDALDRTTRGILAEVLAGNSLTGELLRALRDNDDLRRRVTLLEERVTRLERRKDDAFREEFVGLAREVAREAVETQRARTRD